MLEISLENTVLLQGSTAQEIESMLKCLGAKRKAYKKGAVIYRAGDKTGALGLVLAGSVHIENDDVWGNKSILEHVGPGQAFAETYACVKDMPLMVTVVAAEATDVLFLNVSRILSNCPYRSRLVHNLLSMMAQKNLMLSRRIFLTSAKTIRGRLLSYLSDQAAHHGSHAFSIPFNRQQLADYLGVDRSALSNELAKMQREGILTVQKNRFQLLNLPE